MNKQFRILGLSMLALGGVIMMTETVQAQRSRGGSTDVWKFLAEKYDNDGDGRLTKKEYDRSAEKFKGFDSDGDGVLTADDWKSADGGNRRGSQRSRGVNASGAAPAKGDVAPEFALTMVGDTSDTVKLSSFAGKKPVALVFGSCT